MRRKYPAALRTFATVNGFSMLSKVWAICEGLAAFTSNHCVKWEICDQSKLEGLRRDILDLGIWTGRRTNIYKMHIAIVITFFTGQA